MDKPNYSFRPNLCTPQRTYWVEDDYLCWSAGPGKRQIRLSDIRKVQYSLRHTRGAATFTNKRMFVAELLDVGGNRIVLSPLHYCGFRRWEDRSEDYYPFLRHLVNNAYAANPKLIVTQARHWTIPLRRAVARIRAAIAGRLLVWSLSVFQPLPADRLGDFAARFLRLVGPYTRGQRVARRNLAAAFPERSATEIEQITAGVWDNLGRVCAEFAHLERLWDFDMKSGSGKRISVDAQSLDRVRRLREAGGPVLYFTSHLANWELPAIAAAALQLDSAAVYRRPELGAATDVVIARRMKTMGLLIPVGRGAAARIRTALRRRMHVGMLVDQYFYGGVDVVFFGRTCKVNPSLARFAQLFDCPIHGARAIRRGNRLALEVTGPVQAPRRPDGRIDVAGTMQLIMVVIEGWVRENPEQWLWLHRLWR